VVPEHDQEQPGPLGTGVGVASVEYLQRSIQSSQVGAAWPVVLEIQVGMRVRGTPPQSARAHGVDRTDNDSTRNALFVAGSLTGTH
jgi:hypothetical protein